MVAHQVDAALVDAPAQPLGSGLGHGRRVVVAVEIVAEENGLAVRDTGARTVEARDQRLGPVHAVVDVWDDQVFHKFRFCRSMSSGNQLSV